MASARFPSKHRVFALINALPDRLSPGFIFKSVELNVEPANVVERGTRLTLTCITTILPPGSQDVQFNFFKDHNKHNSVYMSPITNQYTATYTINRTRASDTGTYQCEVKLAGQYQDSLYKTVTVRGTDLFNPITP